MSNVSHVVKINTVGSAGSASGEALLALAIVELLEVYINYHASAPATTDVTFTAPGNPGEKTLLTVTDANTDAYFRPKTQDHDNAGAAVTGSYSHPVIHRNLKIAVTQCDQLTDAVIVTLVVRE